jgi:hypothetical protein
MVQDSSLSEVEWCVSATGVGFTFVGSHTSNVLVGNVFYSSLAIVVRSDFRGVGNICNSVFTESGS